MADIVDVSPNITTTNATPALAAAYGFTSGRAAAGQFVVVAHSDDGNKAFWRFDFLAFRSGDNITIIDQLLGLVGKKTLGALLWDAYLAEGDGNIEIVVKGASGRNIHWHVALNWGYALAPAT